MGTEKIEKISKIVVLIIVTAVITSLLTLLGANYYYTRSDKWEVDNLDRYVNVNNIMKKLAKEKDRLEETIQISDTSKEIEARIELVKAYIDKYYLGEINEDKLIEAAVKGYVRGLRR